MKYVKLGQFAKSPVKGPLQISDDPAVHKKWLATKHNVGLLMEENGLVTADYDVLAEARAAWLTLVTTMLCNLVTKTRRGAHFIFKGVSESWKIDGFDLKGNGHIVWPPSVVRHDEGSFWKYEFVLGDENTEPLPFPAHHFKKPEHRELSTNIEANVDRLRMISKAMAYAATMAPSVAGSGGDHALYRFACHMVRNPPNGFGLMIEEAWPIALMFNQRCSPPWNENIIRRKLCEAKKKG
jgi:hypothetical protein